MSTGRSMYASFFVDGVRYGIDALDVQEVLRWLPMTAVPLAPDEVRGLINLRGQVVTAIDLRRRLGLPPNDSEEPPMNLVVRAPDGPVSILVDEIGDVFEIDGAELEPAPETVSESQRSLLAGICKLDGALLLVIAIDRAVAPAASTAP